MNQRLTAYRRLAQRAHARRGRPRSSTSSATATAPPPPSVENLAEYARIRLHGRPHRPRKPRPRGHDRRPQVPAGREDRSGDAPAAHPEPWRPDAAAAGGRLRDWTSIEAWKRALRGVRRSRSPRGRHCEPAGTRLAGRTSPAVVLVDGPGDVRNRARLHQEAILAETPPGSGRAGRSVRAARPGCSSS